MTNNSRTYKFSTKFCSNGSTGRVFQIVLRGRSTSTSGGNGKFCWENFFSLVTNSSPRLKMNIWYLYTGINNTVFQRFTIFILHISNRILNFLRKVDLPHIFHYFVLPWICPWFHDVSCMIHNSFFFFQTTFTNQFNLLMLFFRLKTNFFSRFY